MNELIVFISFFSMFMFMWYVKGCYSRFKRLDEKSHDIHVIEYILLGVN